MSGRGGGADPNYNIGMDSSEAAEILSDADLVPYAQGSIPYIKELVELCLEADIPAMAGCPPGAGKS